MTIAYGGGAIAIAIDKNVGAIHTTNIYTIPVGYLFVALGIISILIWLGSRGRKNSN